MTLGRHWAVLARHTCRPVLKTVATDQMSTRFPVGLRRRPCARPLVRRTCHGARIGAPWALPWPGPIRPGLPALPRHRLHAARRCTLHSQGGASDRAAKITPLRAARACRLAALCPRRLPRSPILCQKHASPPVATPKSFCNLMKRPRTSNPIPSCAG